MQIMYINDCRDDNAAGRQQARAVSLFQCPVTFVGVQNDLEAAGMLVDVLDAVGDAEAIILVNVAPRHGAAKKWQNGSPFAYCQVGKVLVVGSVDGYTFSLLKKLKLISAVYLLTNIVKDLTTAGLITSLDSERIEATQFRSYEWLPRAAYLLHKKVQLEQKEHFLQEISDVPPLVWFVDNFGNCKTTLLYKEVVADGKETIDTHYGLLSIYQNLKDVPDGTIAFIEGSSGIGGVRFAELVVQGGSAANQLQCASGSGVI